MPTVTVQAHEGERLKVTIQTIQEVERVKYGHKFEEKQTGVSSEGKPVFLNWPVVTEEHYKAQEWVDTKADTFATDRRQYAVGEGQRIVVEAA